MKPAPFLAALCLVAVAAAGCLQGGVPDPFATARDGVRQAAAQVLHKDHDEDGGHRRGALHQGAYNLELVGYSNAFDDSGDPNRLPSRATFNEIALHGDRAYISRHSSDASFGGFSILDVSDAANPRMLGHFVAQGGGDIEVSDDGALAFFATQRNTVEQVVTGTSSSQEPASALARGIAVVDVSDPAHPGLASFAPLPTNGPHTITYVRHPNGSEYLLACTYDLVADPSGGIVGVSPATQRLIAYLVVRNAAGVPGLPAVALVPVAQYQEAGTGLAFPHDATVQTHPLTGKVLITLAYWDLGVRLLDFTLPPQPSLTSEQLPSLPRVGAYSDFSPSAHNAIHLARPFPDLLASQDGPVHVTVAEPEIITAERETGQFTFIDTSDPTTPRRISGWTLPGQDPPLGVTNLDFSPHNFDVWDGKVALTHYHAGVWVVDVSTPENLREPKEVGFYMTAKVRGNSPVAQPDAWSLRVQDGLLYVSDAATGLYILRYTGP